ncbi:hypothetical protein H8E88_02845 [candidate division KSB1 bacterium]|nr:hypothetical protein [candidate division KSB1 bacterium]MBL7095662.1 hypothetical protein [candidate division KSB1 bacterium]
MSLERYKELKNSIKLLLKQITLDSELEDGIDWNLHIEDFKNILKNGSFKKITESHYFEKLARNWCVKDKSRKE